MVYKHGSYLVILSCNVQIAMVTCDWNWVNWTKERLEVFSFPSLTHLAELTRLQIQAEKRYGSPPAELIQYNLNRCPKTLERITLDGLFKMTSDLPYSWCLEVRQRLSLALSCSDASLVLVGAASVVWPISNL